MKNFSATLLTLSGVAPDDARYKLTEGVTRDHRNNRWLSVSIPTCQLFVLKDDMTLFKIVDIRHMLSQLAGVPTSAGQFLSVIGLAAEGGYTLVLGNGTCHLSEDLTTVSRYRQLHADDSIRFNDGVVIGDPDDAEVNGAFIITSLSHKAPMARPGKGSMIVVLPGKDGKVFTLRGSLGLGNGVVQGEKLGKGRFRIYWNDSHECYVRTAVVDLLNGTMEEDMPWVRTGDGRNMWSNPMALPDGLDEVRDAAGNTILVLADWGCGRVVMIDVKTGGTCGVVNLPDGANRPTYAKVDGAGRMLISTETSCPNFKDIVGAGFYTCQLDGLIGVNAPLCRIA